MTKSAFWLFLGIFVLTAVPAFKKEPPIKVILFAAATGICAGYGLKP